MLTVLDHPDTPLHTNGSENDIRCQVTKRKVSGGTRSDVGRDCRDAFLGLAKTCAKLGISILGLSRQPARHPRSSDGTQLARPHPVPWPASIIAIARGFAPVTHSGAAENHGSSMEMRREILRSSLNHEPKDLGTAINALFKSFGGLDLPELPREPMRERATFDE